MKLFPPALFILAAPLLPAGDPPPRANPFEYDPRPDFIARDPGYRERKREAYQRLKALQDELVSAQRKGRKTPCAQQLYLEAKWYVHSTAEFEKAARRMDDLAAILKTPADPHDGRQLESDGSFGCCSTLWFKKLDHATDRLIALGIRWQEPEYPLRLLDRVNTPEKLTEYLDSLLVADVRRTGIDTRYELNSATSCLTRYACWKGTWDEIPAKFELHPKLKQTLLEYQDRKWQDPATGFWGTWYRKPDGSIFKTADLSHTFHLVHFRKGKVERWPQIVATTLAMKDLEYPYGLLEDGKMVNHHNYDAAVLFRYGWPHATPAQKEEIRSQVSRMLDHCLEVSLEPDGTFSTYAESSLGSAFYFGVALLDTLGYFSKQNRFWTDREFPGARRHRDLILNRLNALGLDDPESLWAKWTLAAYKFAEGAGGRRQFFAGGRKRRAGAIRAHRPAYRSWVRVGPGNPR